jgi:hypothetical protein
MVTLPLWPVSINFGTCSYQCFLSNCTPVLLLLLLLLLLLHLYGGNCGDFAYKHLTKFDLNKFEISDFTLTGNRTELKLLYVYEILKLNYNLLVQVLRDGAVEATSRKIAGSITDSVPGIFH